MENHTTFARRLVEGIWPMLSSIDLKVQIQNFGPDHVRVNGIDIRQAHGFWNVPQCKHCFMYRKAAVGYYIAKSNHDTKLAQSIIDLDRRIHALTKNIEHYQKFCSTIDDDAKKNVYLARISYETPMREMLYERLMENLKSIQIA